MKLRVERRWSNGCEICPRLFEGDTWIAEVVGAPHLGFDSVQKAEEIALRVNLHDELVAACKSAHNLLRNLGGCNHDPEYSELAAVLAKVAKENP